MLEARGNLWKYPAEIRVITTNASIRNDGKAVMGRGCANEACRLYPQLQSELGSRLQKEGNHVLFFPELQLYTFPVKDYWMNDADPKLILRSMVELYFCIHTFKQTETRIVMPRPGCGNGRLSWDVVKPLLASLPDNVTVITFEGEP